jgi:hypothetical protein
MPVLIDPNRLFLWCAGDVVVTADRNAPPVIFNSLRTMQNLQYAVPEKLLCCLVDRVRLRE